jgi:hypothetical protein
MAGARGEARSLMRLAYSRKGRRSLPSRPMNCRQGLHAVRTGFIACVALLTSFLFAISAHAAEPAATPKPAADGWYDGVPPDGSFHVRGPVAFQSYAQEDKEKPKESARTQGVRAIQAGAFDATTKYIATCVVDPSDTRGDKARLASTLVKWTVQADVAYQRPVTAGKLTGVEFQIADPQKTLRVRLFAAPERICTLYVQWNPYAKPRDEDIDRFLGSFALGKR